MNITMINNGINANTMVITIIVEEFLVVFVGITMMNTGIIVLLMAMPW